MFTLPSEEKFVKLKLYHLYGVFKLLTFCQSINLLMEPKALFFPPPTWLKVVNVDL